MTLLGTLKLLLLAGPWELSICTVLGVPEQICAVRVAISSRKETQVKIQDAGRGLCPLGGRVSNLRKK